MTIPDMEALLGPGGPIARAIPGFRHRPQQVAMAQAVAEVFEEAGSLVCEAGTGTGKTFAYLAPALASGRKTIVSTGTRNLQDQLFHRDLPLVREALGLGGRIALLKGRANYLCPQRLGLAVAGGQLPPAQARDLQRIRAWAGRTRSGDIAEAGLPEDAAIWPWVTSTSDNCLGADCPDFDACFLVEARRQAQEADLVVVNHHLLCADLALKDGGFGELLPDADAFVVDEAHQLPEVAGAFFGMTLSSRQLLDLVRDTTAAHHQEAADQPDLGPALDHLTTAARAFRLAFGVEPRRGTWGEMEASEAIQEGLDRLEAALSGLIGALEGVAGRGKGLDNCLGRATDLLDTLDLLRGEDEQEAVRWFETGRQGFRLNRTPMDISKVLGPALEGHPGAWVFTSATLAVGGSFAHFSHQLGLEDPATGIWDSPFDYARQALLYVPRELPLPAQADYNRRVAELASGILELSRGRAFLLYTSHRALQEARSLLAPRLPFPLLVQGDAPRAELLERFRRQGNAVLLGTASFWEGVDVRGEALSCVIIDKLPFAAPGDPVLKARIEAVRRSGGNPFADFQLPQAVITLKQGAGRLIRDETDRGLLVICDPRLLTKSYGRVFLDSLPPMARTRELDVVRRFFALEAA